MRAYQLSTSFSQHGWCSLSTSYQCSYIEQWTGGRCHTVPNLPGRANDFNPYPFDRRRRRR
ncbi:MAG TPA: hypothetical protein VE843_16005 [Ktedonobacteraceae bacterium]|nr:hypothetical protein [Ktedonobacteraceae bacterium]